MSSIRLTLAALAIALGLAISFWNADVPDTAAPVAPPDKAVAASSDAPAMLPPAPRLEAPAGRGERPWLETLKKFNSARSYRAFIYDISKNHPQGAIQYALQVMNVCANALLTVDEAKLSGAAQRQALATLHQRCDMSKDELNTELATLAGKFQHLKPEQEGLVAATAAFDNARNRDQERDAISALLATEDPTAIMRMTYPPQDDQRQSLHFQGREYQWGPGENVDFAMRLAQCDLGLDCGPEAPATLLLCVRNNWCAASFRDGLRNGLDAGQPGRFAQVVALATQLAAQIRAKNTAAFIPSK